MCGIIAGIAQRPISPILIDGLEQLEYRGYDSAGMCVIDSQGQSRCVKVVGKVAGLAAAIEQEPLLGQIGIAHTRWATHGKPTKMNAHPHVVGHIAIVHNGIIENADTLRAQLIEQGCTMQSETDSEVIAHLLARAWHEAASPIAAITHVTQQLTGAYGLVVLDVKQSERLYAVRSGSPLVLGIGVGEHFLASDILSLRALTSQFIYLEEGDIAELSADQFTLYDQAGQAVTREIHEQQASIDAATKGPYKHYMHKEIYQQPQAVQDTLQHYLTRDQNMAVPAALQTVLKQAKNIKIVACGTSYHAGLVAKHWFEAQARLPCDVEIASEFRYRDSITPEKTVMIAISQSGETADTLAALRLAKSKDYLATIAISNVATSTLVREADHTLLTFAGPEIGVASTKAFTTQLVVLALLTLMLQQLHDRLDRQLLQMLIKAPQYLEMVLQLDQDVKQVAQQLVNCQSCLFLGRGALYPVALEGALKLKEISYIHAEAYPAGELKHGPLALVDETMPVIVAAAEDALLEKIKSNMAEVHSRGGVLYAISHSHDLPSQHAIYVATAASWLDPLIFTVPMQLLAYHVAVLKGTDVDQPRNLAKSVTVE